MIKGSIYERESLHGSSSVSPPTTNWRRGPSHSQINVCHVPAAPTPPTLLLLLLLLLPITAGAPLSTATCMAWRGQNKMKTTQQRLQDSLIVIFFKESPIDSFSKKLSWNGNCNVTCSMFIYYNKSVCNDCFLQSTTGIVTVIDIVLSSWAQKHWISPRKEQWWRVTPAG